MDLTGSGYGSMASLSDLVINLKGREVLDELRNCKLFKKDSAWWIHLIS
jgi:hypothetical protein